LAQHQYGDDCLRKVKEAAEWSDDSGGFRNDLLPLDDQTGHDDRYDRTVEYILIMKWLFEEPASLTFTGDYYAVKNRTLKSGIPPELVPELFVSGTPAAGVVTSARLPSHWSRAVKSLGRSFVCEDNRKADRPGLTDVAGAEASRQ
jgi:alkanesulfonate monooxygenase SsuD/methylene tetrahydromethanopterin reductase-like flavin-dependent oxidoreductase (luciferase family)